MTPTNDDKLKEELWKYYNDNELYMNKFIDYIIKKAREGYVKKEEAKNRQLYNKTFKIMRVIK